MKKFKNNMRCYLGGDLMTKGNRIVREMERKEVEEMGFDFYNPMLNNSINDKANVGADEDLPQRIVREDLIRLYDHDIITLDVAEAYIGTMAETNLLFGWKTLSEKIKEVLDNNELNETEKLDEVNYICDKMIGKVVLPHSSDIRRLETQPQASDKRSFSWNAFLYGVVLRLTNNFGFRTWDQVKEELKKIKEENK